MQDGDLMEVAQWLEEWFISHVTRGVPMSEDEKEAMQDALCERFPDIKEEILEQLDLSSGPLLEGFQALLQRHSATKH